MSTVAVNPPKTPITEGSNGIATATIPNICKMPGPPAPFVPTPLPNIGKSGKDPSGYSTSVKIEGKAVAIQGASFGSMGDIASKGLGGGLVSSNCEGPTKFIAPGSMDVTIEGKNVQQLSDQMMNNCGPSGSPANAATMMGAIQDALLVKYEQHLCKVIKACDQEENDKAHGPGKKPTGKWCNAQAPGEKPGTTNAMVMGRKKGECAERKLEANKHKLPPDLAAAVNVEKDIPAKGGGVCRPDVTVGAAPNCQKVYDFKTSCRPDTPAPESWPIMRSGSPRKPPNPSYEGKTQGELYRDSCGKDPDMIHPNSPMCNP